MPQYLILIHHDEDVVAQEVRDHPGRMTADHIEFQARHADCVRGGAALEPVATARSVRPGRDGAAIVTDGAFAETKEVLGGYYLIEAADLDAAVAVASEVPTAGGGVEVRAIRPDPANA